MANHRRRAFRYMTRAGVLDLARSGADNLTVPCQAFRDFVKREGIAAIRLPPRSPTLNAHAEGWVRGVRDECLSRLIPIGQGMLRGALREYGAHFHQERNHQGLGNVLIMPAACAKHRGGPVIRRARLWRIAQLL